MSSVESVLNQTYRNYEVIVLDDGSTDDTRVRLSTLSQERNLGPDVLRYFYQDNQGQSAARNRGIAEARGDWIAFLDSDDTWLPEKLERQIDAIRTFDGQCGACFTDATLLGNEGRKTSAFDAAGRHYEGERGIVADAVTPLARSFGGPWVTTIVARTDLVKQLGGFDPKLHFAEDYDFLFRLSLATPHCYVNRSLAIIDRTGTLDETPTRRWDKLEFRLQARELMYSKWLSLDPPLPDSIRQIVHQKLREVHSAWANVCVENRQYRDARTHLSKAAHWELTPSLAVKWLLVLILPRLTRRLVPRSKSYFELT